MVADTSMDESPSNALEAQRVIDDMHTTPVNSEAAADVKPEIIGLLQACDYDLFDLWRLIQTFVEVKKPIAVLPGLLHVPKYSRQVLYEQVDRRFIFGLVYAKTHLTVWLVDRSGALGSKSFDVHEDPKLLIRVIACMTTKSPVELEWDTHFRMVTNKPNQRLESRPSWEVPCGNRLNDDNPYDQHWWILPVPKPNEEPDGERENFVIWGAISVAREVICGRATRVWQAWKEADLELEEAERKIYVIKDNWRDDCRGVEGELYDKIGPDAPGVAVLYSHEVVTFGGRADTTLKFAQKGLAHSGAQLDIWTRQDFCNREYHPDVYLHKYCIPRDWEDDFEVSQGPEYSSPRRRTHSRTVMGSHGSSLSELIDLQELVKGLHDAIKGHQYAVKKGVLHRDISGGNILLTGYNEPNRGIIIYFDNTVAFESHTPLLDAARTGNLAFMSAEISDVIHRPYFDNTTDQEFTFLSLEEDIPEPEHKVIRHETIHDMEGFFWILCWLCISFTGPGTRVVLDEMSWKDQFLRTVVHKLFEKESFQANATHKQLIIVVKKEFQRQILNHMQIYFHPLANALVKLYNVLREAYRTRSWSNIHDRFIGIFAAAKGSLKNLDDDEKRAKYREMERAQRTIRAKGLLPPSPPAAVLRAMAKKAAGDIAAKQAAEVAKVKTEVSRKASTPKIKRKADYEDDFESSGAKKARKDAEEA